MTLDVGGTLSAQTQKHYHIGHSYLIFSCCQIPFCIACVIVVNTWTEHKIISENNFISIFTLLAVNEQANPDLHKSTWAKVGFPAALLICSNPSSAYV